MKMLILSLVLPVTALAAKEELVTCQLKNFKSCVNCEKRIPASCENHAFNGSLETKLKPKKVQWMVSNTSAGVEKIVTAENTSMTLKDLKSAKDLKSIAGKMKVKTTGDETVALYSVQLNANTAIYKDQTGMTVAATMKPQGNLRNVASTQDPMAGGAKRAQAATKNHK